MNGQAQAQADPAPALTIITFGHKHGMPAQADLLFDARILPNPYWVEEMRHRKGTEAEVAAYVLDNPAGRRFLELLLPLVCFIIEQAGRSGRESIIIAIGCTGGCHRSVAVAEALAAALAPAVPRLTLSHRDLAKP